MYREGGAEGRLVLDLGADAVLVILGKDASWRERIRFFVHEGIPFSTIRIVNES